MFFYFPQSLLEHWWNPDPVSLAQWMLLALCSCVAPCVVYVFTQPFAFLTLSLFLIAVLHLHPLSIVDFLPPCWTANLVLLGLFPSISLSNGLARFAPAPSTDCSPLSLHCCS